MRRPAILMLLLAVGLGFLAVYLARDWLQTQVSAEKSAEVKQISLTKVVVAKRPLHFGDELSASSLEEISWPTGNVPLGAFTSIDQILAEGKRRVVLKSVQLNEPILKSKISGFGGRATLSTIIDKELRAVTVRVNDVNGVAGFVLPSDHVDILLTRKPKGSKEQSTDVLMQNIKVLGIDQDANESKDQPKVVRAVTLEVTAEQSQKLTLAQTVGQLALALRSATNNTPFGHRRIRERDLVDDRIIEDRAVAADVLPKAVKKVKKAVRVRARRSTTSVRVFRGVKPKIHTVTNEAASPVRRVTGGTKPPTKLVPNAKNSTDAKKEAPADRPKTAPQGNSAANAPISSAPVRLTPGVSL
jgi:pilus assembly protein CpaB